MDRHDAAPRIVRLGRPDRACFLLVVQRARNSSVASPLILIRTSTDGAWFLLGSPPVVMPFFRIA